MSDEFEIQTDIPELSFVANRETGRWAITSNHLEGGDKSLSLPFPTQTLEGAKMIVLNMGRACNLRCVYCSVGEKKEEKNCQLKEEIGVKALERVAEMKQKKKQVVFHGSEPMLNEGLIKKLTKYGHSLDPSIQFCMQSNGTLFTPSNIKRLRELGVGIGISLDGTACHQNALRPLTNGGKTYDLVIDSVEEVKAQQGGISVVSVITKKNVNELEEIVEDFEKRGIRKVSFNPVSSFGNVSLMPTSEELIMNMSLVFNQYV